MTPHGFGQLPDQQLLDMAARLEADVSGLEYAQGEVGQRIRDEYAARFDAARAELSRRKEA